MNQIRVLSEHSLKLFTFACVHISYAREAETSRLISTSICLSVTITELYLSAFHTKIGAPILINFFLFGLYMHEKII